MTSARTVLIIDDQAAVRSSLNAILSARFNVVPCENGQDAIRFATEHTGAVFAAFVDYAMPTMDGNQVCAALRNLDPTISLVGFSGIENAPFQGPLFAVLLKKGISTEQILTLAANAVQSAEKRRRERNADLPPLG